jgi:hypothetical protein
MYEMLPTLAQTTLLLLPLLLQMLVVEVSVLLVNGIVRKRIPLLLVVIVQPPLHQVLLRTFALVQLIQECRSR